MENTSNNTRSERPKLPTAKWGAACAPCATAKAKCIRSNLTPDSKCDRCERLFKDCSGQVHRPRKKRQVKPSKTAQIEERLNGLVSLLKASGELSNPDLAAEAAAAIDPLLCERPTPSASPAGSFQPPSHNPWAIPDTYNSYAPPSCICRPQGGGVPPPPDTDDALLDIYRNELQRVYPFVIIPSHISAAALKGTRPFLMSAIRMVASFRSPRSMRAQMYHLMKHLSDHMLIRSEKSLDLLLGIIVIAGWHQHHCFVHAQLNNLISLAISLVGELGLNRHPRTSERSIKNMVKPPTPAARTNEERRALAGVWFLASSMSVDFFKLESMRFTNYLQECLKELEDAEEYKTDASLVYLVRIQHLTERIYQLNAKDQALEEVSGFPMPPISAYVASFQAELDAVRNNLPEHLKTDNIFMTYYFAATLRLYEPPIVDTALVTSLTNSLLNHTPRTPSPLNRLYQSRDALLAWLNNWLAIPASLYYCQTTSQSAQLVYGLTMLGRWARLATPETMFESKSSMSPESITDANGESPFGADSQTSGSAGSPSRVWSAPPSIVNTETCLYGQVIMRQGADPKLPAAVAVLRSLLKEHPGFSIDIPQILYAFCSRFEEANEIASENGQAEHNVWRMGAIKIRITQIKLERWAELVTQGTEVLSLDDGDSRDVGMGDAQATHIDVGAASNGPAGYVQGNLQHPSQMPMQSYVGDSPWPADLLQGVDPSAWFDGYLDWSTVIMNGMGTVEQ